MRKNGFIYFFLITCFFSAKQYGSERSFHSYFHTSERERKSGLSVTLSQAIHAHNTQSLFAPNPFLQQPVAQAEPWKQYIEMISEMSHDSIVAGITLIIKILEDFREASRNEQANRDRIRFYIRDAIQHAQGLGAHPENTSRYVPAELTEQLNQSLDKLKRLQENISYFENCLRYYQDELKRRQVFFDKITNNYKESIKDIVANKEALHHQLAQLMRDEVRFSQSLQELQLVKTASEKESSRSPTSQALFKNAQKNIIVCENSLSIHQQKVAYVQELLSNILRKEHGELTELHKFYTVKSSLYETDLKLLHALQQSLASSQVVDIDATKFLNPQAQAFLQQLKLPAQFSCKSATPLHQHLYETLCARINQSAKLYEQYKNEQFVCEHIAVSTQCCADALVQLPKGTPKELVAHFELSSILQQSVDEAIAGAKGVATGISIGAALSIIPYGHPIALTAGVLGAGLYIAKAPSGTTARLWHDFWQLERKQQLEYVMAFMPTSASAALNKSIQEIVSRELTILQQASLKAFDKIRAPFLASLEALSHKAESILLEQGIVEVATGAEIKIAREAEIQAVQAADSMLARDAQTVGKGGPKSGTSAASAAPRSAAHGDVEARHPDAGDIKRSSAAAEAIKELHPNGIYEGAGYHHIQSKGLKSPPPKDGQLALDKSVALVNESDTNLAPKRRVAAINNEYVVLARTMQGDNISGRLPQYHGHVRTWKEPKQQALTQEMRNALIEAGITDRNGKILKQ